MCKLNRLAIRQKLEVNLPIGDKGLRPADENQHVAVRRKCRLGGGVGEVGELYPVCAGNCRRLKPGWLKEKIDGSANYSHPGFNLRSEEHTSELQSRLHIVCRLLL